MQIREKQSLIQWMKGLSNTIKLYSKLNEQTHATPIEDTIQLPLNTNTTNENPGIQPAGSSPQRSKKLV